MNILFIYPNIGSHIGINHGLASISGVLKAHGHRCRLVHVFKNDGDQAALKMILTVVDEFKPDIVGFSAVTQQYAWCVRIAKELKRHCTCPVMIGGVHCTMDPEGVALDDVWDCIFIGEGEPSILELLEKVTGALGPAGGGRALEGDRIMHNRFTPFANLANLPRIDYELFDLESYLSDQSGWMRIMASRGCPHKCSYCLNRNIFSACTRRTASIPSAMPVRHLPIPYLLDIISDLKRKYVQMKVINFDDDIFTVDKQYISDFADAYSTSSIGLPYVINSHVQHFDSDIADHLKDSGCIIVRFGVECGNHYIRSKVLHRNMSNEQIIEAFDAAHAANLHTQAFIMLGIPHETIENVKETIHLCATLNAGRFRWSYLYPYPGTILFETINKSDRRVSTGVYKSANYFDQPFFGFGSAHDLFLSKLGKVFSWYVNALTKWQCSTIYQDLTRWIDSMDYSTWMVEKHNIQEVDRQVSQELTSKGIQHYSICYSPVTGVRSDYLDRELELSKSCVLECAA